jgi:hypothetical protein
MIVLEFRLLFLFFIIITITLDHILLAYNTILRSVANPPSYFAGLLKRVCLPACHCPFVFSIHLHHVDVCMSDS